MQREKLFLLVLVMIGVSLLVGEAYFRSITYRFIPPAPQQSVIQVTCPTPKMTITTLPNGHKLYNATLFECGVVTDSLSAIYYSAANAARAEALAWASSVLDAFHAAELVTLLLSLLVVSRMVIGRHPQIPTPRFEATTLYDYRIA